MSNVKTFPGVVLDTGAPNAELVELFEALLHKAKTGELRNFVGTGFTADGMRLRAIGGLMPDAYQVMGAIHWLAHEYVDRVMDRSEE